VESGHSDRHGMESSGEQPEGAGDYPTDHVLGIVESPDEAAGVVEALIGSGFLVSEVNLACGQAAADVLHANTGRSGLANIAIRIAERLGVSNDEMQLKASYEQALRDGHLVLLVATPTEERKELATRTLREHGAHTVNYMGRFSIEMLVPPAAT